MVKALEENPGLQDVSDYTSDSGEGRWTVEEAINLAVPMPVISASLFARFASRQESSPTLQAVAALRGQFGGHQVMTIAEGDGLRAEAVAGPKSADAARKKADRKEAPTRSAKAAAAKGRKAAAAGPSSGGGATSSSGRGVASAGPTSGTGSTRKRAAKKS
jgi:6-phosphogluconate dehydrogenase